MTDDEALQIGRQAVEDARRQVGGNNETLLKELEARAAGDPRVAEAYAQTGTLLLCASQNLKH
jgi:hypothetical protein